MPEPEVGVSSARSGPSAASRGDGGAFERVRGRSAEREARGQGPERGRHGARRPWRPRRPWLPPRGRAGGRRPRRGGGGEAAAGAAGRDAAYWPEDGGGGGDPRADGSASPPPDGVSPRGRGRPRRLRSHGGPRGSRGRRAAPTPPRAFRGSRSPTSPRSRLGSWFPPPRARLLPRPARARFQGRRRGVSRADFARYVRGDPPGDGGGEVDFTSLCSASLMEQSLRITIRNEHFSVGTPEQQRQLSDQLRSPVDNPEEAHRIALNKDAVQYTRDHKRHISQEEGPLTQDILHHSDSCSHICSDVELLHGKRPNRDKLKGSYSTGLEERSRESKRPRYDDTDMGDDDPGFALWIRNCLQQRQSPRFRDHEFQEQDRVKIKQEDREHCRCLGQDPVGVVGVPSALELGHSSRCPEEVSLMSKKSVLKKQIEVAAEPPSQPKRFPCGTSSSQDHTLCPGQSSLPLSGPTAAFASKLEHQTATGLDSPLREKFGGFLCHEEKLDLKAEVPEEHTDFLLPHERAVEDGSGFSRILSVLSVSTSTQQRNRLSFFDIEDEEKFLYGDEEEVFKSESPSKPPGGSESEVMRQKASCCIPSPTPAVKQEPVAETSPECAMVHELVRTIGLDSVISEVSKLASCSQEHAHDSKDVLSTVKSTGNHSVWSQQTKVPQSNPNPSCCFHCQNPEHCPRECRFKHHH